MLATIITVVFATRTGLRIHRRDIGLLHLIGAHDRYIARQFERQALWLSLQGAVVGIVFAIGTVFLLADLAGRIEIETGARRHLHAGCSGPFSRACRSWRRWLRC